MRKWVLMSLGTLVLGLTSSCTSQAPVSQLPSVLQPSKVQQAERDEALTGKEEMQNATGLRISFYRLEIVLDWL